MKEEILIFDRDILGVEPRSPLLSFDSIRDISFQFNRDVFIASIAGVHSRTIKGVYDSEFFMNPLVPLQSNRNTCSNSWNWKHNILPMKLKWNYPGIEKWEQMFKIGKSFCQTRRANIRFELFIGKLSLHFERKKTEAEVVARKFPPDQAGSMSQDRCLYPVALKYDSRDLLMINAVSNTRTTI